MSRKRIALVGSRVQIYSRIVNNILNAIAATGDSPVLLEGDDSDSLLDLLGRVSVDYLLITNDFCPASRYLEHRKKFAFECIDSFIVFIHHDTSFCMPATLDHTMKKLNALQHISERSVHLVIEESNFTLYKSLGLNVEMIHHVTEFDNVFSPSNSRDFCNISFVGHVAPYSTKYIQGNGLIRAAFASAYWQRLTDARFSAQPFLFNYVDRCIGNGILFSAGFHMIDSMSSELEDLSLYRIPYWQILMHEYNRLSLPMRGDYLRLLQDFQVCLFGGDPSGTWSEETTLLMSNLKNYPHVSTSQLNQVYARSRISLNFHSLQFDTAYNNRVVDIFAAGGFCLTDYRKRLSEISKYTDLFTFNTHYELLDKIELFMSARGSQIMDDLTPEIAEEIKQNCSYIALVGNIRRFYEKYRAV